MKLTPTEEAEAQQLAILITAKIGPSVARRKLAVDSGTLYRWRRGLISPSRMRLAKLREVACRLK